LLSIDLSRSAWFRFQNRAPRRLISDEVVRHLIERTIEVVVDPPIAFEHAYEDFPVEPVFRLLASRSLSDRSRRVVVKARVVRQKAGASAPLSAHLRYLQRDGVSKEGEPARKFGAVEQDSDARRFAERCEGDRHHFRFIVSPDDALE
jgi:hypothetical protein